MYADPEILSKMVIDIVVAAEWTSFTILYETPEWLPRVAKLLELYDSNGYTVTVRRIDLNLSTKNFRSILRRVKLSTDTCIVIECSIDSLAEILKQAQQVGLLIDKYEFIITNLDAHTIDLEPFQYSDASITLVRMIDTTSAILTEYAEYLKKSSSAEKNAGDDESAPENENEPELNENEMEEEAQEPPEQENNEEEQEGDDAPENEQNGEEADDTEAQEENNEETDEETNEETTTESEVEEAGKVDDKYLKNDGLIHYISIFYF